MQPNDCRRHHHTKDGAAAASHLTHSQCRASKRYNSSAMARAMKLALCCTAVTALLAPPPKRITHTKPRAMGLAGPVDPAAALAVSTVTGDVRKAMTFGALFLSSALLHAAEVSITTLYPWKVKEFAEEERCDLGVPSC